MQTLFLKVVNMSITSCYVILAVLLIRLLLRRAPKKYSCLLWLPVGFRLCCPFSFQSVFSLFSLRLFDMAPAQLSGGTELAYIPPDIGMAAQPQITVGIPAANAILSGSLPAATPQASINPMQAWIAVGTLIWLAGLAILLLYAAVSYICLHRRMRTAILLEGCVYRSERISSPFILGFIRPKIYVPFNTDESSLQYVLAHEHAHLKRGDHIVKPFAFILLCFHWFNPLCWLAFSLLSRDMEMSCDEQVLSAGSGSKPYSTALLSFAAGRAFPTPGPLAFGESDIKIRIKNALRWKKPHAAVAVIAVLLCIMTAAVCVANPEEKQDLSFLNYRQLANLAWQTEQLPTSYEEQTKSVSGTIDGAALGKFLSDANWTRAPERNVLYSRMIQIDFGAELYLQLFDCNLASVHSLDRERFYSINPGDFEALLKLFAEDNRSDSSAEAPTTPVYDFEGTLFRFGSKEYDITQRAAGVNAITSCQEIGAHIVIEGHINPKSGFYTIFNTKTGQFEKDFYGCNLFFYQEDINRFVYSFWNEIYTGDGQLIGTCDLTESEYIYALAFAEDETALYVEALIAGGKKDRTERFPLTWQNTLDPIIAGLFDVMAEKGANADNMGVLLQASADEYNTLLNYGDYTLEYVFREFLKGGQTDLRASIMCHVMDNLIGGEAIALETETAQEYFDAWRAHGQRQLGKSGADFIRQHAPKTYLLLQMDGTLLTQKSESK